MAFMPRRVPEDRGGLAVIAARAFWAGNSLADFGTVAADYPRHHMGLLALALYFLYGLHAFRLY